MFERFTRSEERKQKNPLSAERVVFFFHVFMNPGSTISSVDEGKLTERHEVSLLILSRILQSPVPSVNDNNTLKLQHLYLRNASWKTELCRKTGSGSHSTPGTEACGVVASV